MGSVAARIRRPARVSLTVTDGYQRAGLGTALFQLLVDAARDHGAEVIETSAPPGSGPGDSGSR